MLNINEFYELHEIDDDFDECFYVQNDPELADFYQPYCRDNGISERKRLFYHWKMYGEAMGLYKKYTTFHAVNPTVATITNLYKPFICVTPDEKETNIQIVIRALEVRG